MVAKGDVEYIWLLTRTRKNETACDEQQQRRMDNVEDTLVLPSCIIYAFFIGCPLHVLHLSVNAGMDNPFFMGPLGKGAWHNWPRQRLVSLLGIIWCNTSRSDVANMTWRQYTNIAVKSAPSPPLHLDFQCGSGFARARFLRCTLSANSAAT